MKTDTPLLLEEYFFPVVQVVANSAAPENDIELNFDINVSLRENKKEKLYQVAVDIHSIDEEEAAKQPYTIHLVVIGVFSVDPEFPNIPKILHVTGSSMLYSAAREFLITITSRGPWDAVSLPTFSFFEQYKSIMEEKSEQEKDTETEETVT